MSYLWYWPSGGWNFDTWKAAHPWQLSSSKKSGLRDLEPVLGRSANLEDWKQERMRLLALVHELLGEVTDTPPHSPLPEMLSVQKIGSVTAQRLRYRLTDSEWGYAWLLIPHNRGKKSLPVVIALHQTVPQGKDEPVGLNGDPKLAYGKELAEAGFAVFAPDAIGFGERAKDDPKALYRSADQFFAAHPKGSVMGKMAWDIQRAVDTLQTIPGIDASRIGCIGHSHGGYGTLFAMLFEDRINAGVISCGITAFRTDPNPERWWRSTALIPRLGYYDGAMEMTPFDFHHLIALIAPRPLMVVAALDDSFFPNTEGMPLLLQKARRVYQEYGAENSLHSWVFHGPHSFPQEARSRAIRLFEDALQQARNSRRKLN